MKTQNQFEADYTTQAEILIKHYNECKNQNQAIIPEIAASAKRYADDSDGVAKLNNYKLDQLVNDSLTNEEYSSIDIIGEMWEKGLYKPYISRYEERLQPGKKESKRMSKANKLKAVIEEFERLEMEKEEFAFNLAYDELDKLKENNPFAWQVFTELDKETLVKLAYKENAVKAALINKSNLNAEMKLKQLLNINFQVNGRYTKNEIKQTLQRLYNAVGLKDKHGNIKIATAEQLGEYGRYELQEGKKKVKDKFEPTFTILRAQFELKVAA